MVIENCVKNKVLMQNKKRIINYIDQTSEKGHHMVFNLSIIIPVYNAEKYIERCINSILQQNINLLNYELIIINDGSTDNSELILQKYSSHENILIINQENSGTGSARNRGLDNVSNSDYIWFIDADDYIEKDAFSQIEKLIISNKFDIISFDYYLVGLTGKNQIKSDFTNKNIDDYFGTIRALFLWKNIYKTNIILNNSIRFIAGIKNIEDFHFNIQFYINSNSVKYENLFIYNYCVNLDSTSRNISSKNLLKLAEDSLIVHKSVNEILQSEFSCVKKQIISDLLNKSIVGFFYSLFKFNYSFKLFFNYYKTYVSLNLIPVSIRKKNLKYSIFQLLINKKYLFMVITFTKKIF